MDGLISGDRGYSSRDDFLESKHHLEMYGPALNAGYISQHRLIEVMWTPFLKLGVKINECEQEMHHASDLARTIQEQRGWVFETWGGSLHSLLMGVDLQGISHPVLSPEKRMRLVRALVRAGGFKVLNRLLRKHELCRIYKLSVSRLERNIPAWRYHISHCKLKDWSEQSHQVEDLAVI